MGSQTMARYNSETAKDTSIDFSTIDKFWSRKLRAVEAIVERLAEEPTRQAETDTIRILLGSEPLEDPFPELGGYFVIARKSEKGIVVSFERFAEPAEADFNKIIQLIHAIQEETGLVAVELPKNLELAAQRELVFCRFQLPKDTSK